MGQRRKAREAAFRLLYSREQSGAGFSGTAREIEENTELEENSAVFASELIKGTTENIQRIDSLISECSRNWKLERILPTDRNIMRMAVYELIAGTAPPAVVINEAIEISKKFGTSCSGNFVNGILDCARKRLLTANGRRP